MVKFSVYLNRLVFVMEDTFSDVGAHIRDVIKISNVNYDNIIMLYL